MVKENKNNFLLIITIVAVVLSFVNMVAILYNLGNFNISGNAVDEGTAELTVDSNIGINFTDYVINWSSGTHSNNSLSALLVSNGTVTGGTWSAESSGLVLENIGNVNISLELSTGKDASEFIGGTEDGGPEYKWQIIDSEDGSCAGTLSYDTFSTVSKTEVVVCDNFGSYDSANSLRIDVLVKIPKDTPKDTKTDTITATASGLS